ncbi:MAG: hypothetical protein HC860_18690 [Alkalinema sp. RU_4_3]|nr:hypothetical protein [Alkalinema sp. RU_4_3]NJR70446.1 hypothetical protein [Synechococcales cyanobacterium CRU_2_2]
MQISRGDRVTVTGYPEDYPLMVLAVAGGKVAIGSSHWPAGANWAIDPSQITSVNGLVYAEPKPATHQRRKAA